MMLRDMIRQHIDKLSDKVIVEQAMKRARNWNTMATHKLIPLSEVSYVLALLVRSGTHALDTESANKPDVQKTTTVDVDGNKVIEVTASEEIQTKSEAG